MISRAELSFLRSLAEDNAAEIDRGLEEDFRGLQAQAAELQDAEVLCFESWDWAEATESMLLQVAADIAKQGVAIRKGVAAWSLSPDEAEVSVEVLREQAAFSDALLADAADLVAVTRRVREKDLRRLAAEEHLVEPEMAGLLADASEETDSALEHGHVPTPEELARAAAVEDAAALLAERLARMSGRLTRRAAAARPGEEALVAGLRRQAANADAARATVEDFAESVRRFRAAAGTGRPIPDHDGGAGAAHMTNIAVTNRTHSEQHSSIHP
ncbi:hypothetical protein EJB05_52338, partial [Eragrostis curvula]